MPITVYYNCLVWNWEDFVSWWAAIVVYTCWCSGLKVRVFLRLLDLFIYSGSSSWSIWGPSLLYKLMLSYFDIGSIIESFFLQALVKGFNHSWNPSSRWMWGVASLLLLQNNIQKSVNSFRTIFPFPRCQLSSTKTDISKTTRKRSRCQWGHSQPLTQYLKGAKAWTENPRFRNQNIDESMTFEPQTITN